MFDCSTVVFFVLHVSSNGTVVRLNYHEEIVKDFHFTTVLTLSKILNVYF